MKRTVVLMALICLASLSANAQIFKKHSSDADKTESKFVWQADLYLQDKWGVGFTVRKETSPYFGWNLIGASYMSGWYKNECPKNFSIINVRLMGLRFQIPIYKNLNFLVRLLALSYFPKLPLLFFLLKGHLFPMH